VDNCEGCSIVRRPFRLCRIYNYERTCPCTLCLMKVMKCGTLPAMNDTCAEWKNWFEKEHIRRKYK